MVIGDVPCRLRTTFGVRVCAGLHEGPTSRLFRSRALTGARAEDVEALRALGIEVIYDLRKEVERRENPTPAVVRESFEVRTCPVDLQNDASRNQGKKPRRTRAVYGNPGERMLLLYGAMADCADEIRNVVSAIMADDRPALIHCANGKDRAGVTCASVQLACGVARGTVYADYLSSNEYNAAMNKRDLARCASFMSPGDLEVLAAMFEARAEYLDAFVDAIEGCYGSFARWVTCR